MATFDPDLSRGGPGLLLRDLRSGRSEQVDAVVRVIAAARPDVLLLTGFDWDHGHAALDALAALLDDQGLAYPHRLAERPNSGLDSGADLDGDGRLGGPRDAQGYGAFTGQDGMAILSRWPLALLADHSATLWAEAFPGRLGEALDPAHGSIQRLSGTGHWQVAVDWDGAPLQLLAFSADTPAFGDRNSARNHDEIAFWGDRLPDGDFVLLGKANLDPADGAGDRSAIGSLLADPRLQDPQPRSRGGALDGAGDRNHVGDPALDTASYRGRSDPGNLRVSYVLPAAGLAVRGAGVLWPAPGEPLSDEVALASGHRLVWVDLARPATR